MANKQVMRLVRFVNEMKHDRYPNAESFARRLLELDHRENLPLATSAKTVQRDIDYLRTRLKAPIEYDATRKGYCLWDKNWTLPYLTLQSDELFAVLFSGRVSRPFLPAPLQQELGEVESIQMAAGEPGRLNLSALESVVVATGAVLPLTPEITGQVIRAWSETRTLQITYAANSDQGVTARDIDIHALLLSEGVWYARAWCHLRKGMRSFALHRIKEATLTDATFVRSATIVDEVRRGALFDYEYCHNVRVRCSAARARYFKERVWFPGQEITEQSDGTLDVFFPCVQDPLIHHWVLGFMGEVTVVEPASLREHLLAIGKQIVAGHRAVAAGR